jgi:glycogen synthase
MRILQLAQFYDPVIGGEERHVNTLSQCLAQRGHSVTLITFATASDEGESRDGDVRIIRVRSGASRLPFLYSDPSWPHAVPIPDPAVTRAISKEVEENRPDIAHGHNWIVNSALKPLRRAGVPIIVTLHDYSQVCSTKRFVQKRQNECTGPAPAKCTACSAEKFGRLSGATTFVCNAVMSRQRRRNVDQFISVSHAVASRVAIRSNETMVAAGVHSTVIPNFIPDSQVVDDLPPIRSDAPIVFVGDMSNDKGISVLLDAYGRLEDPPQLVLVGRYTPETPWNLPSGASATGPLPHSEAMNILKGARLMVVPSTWQDPCPTVVLEAMAAGRPVVASAVGGITDMVVDGETGLLAPPGDAKALSESIAKVLGDPELASSMGLAGRDRSRSYTVSAVVDRLEKVYLEHVSAR